jgi:hypothetical protein
MNKGRRNELRDLKWNRRLKILGLKRIDPKDHIGYRDQGKPCSCVMCSFKKYKRPIKHRNKIFEV